MARRIRILIYDGPEEWIALTKSNESVQSGTRKFGPNRSIVSIEADVAEFDALAAAHEATGGESIKVYVVSDNDGRVNGAAIV